MPSELEQLASVLYKLDLSGNPSLMDPLPFQLFSVSSVLSELIITDSALTTIPPATGLIRTLSLLDLSRNSIQTISNTLFDCWPHLQVLQLSGNCISLLNDNVGHLRSLERLILGERIS